MRIKKKKNGLMETYFHKMPDNQPHEIIAYKDGIGLHVGNLSPIMLTPKHIEAIRAMSIDWWDKLWAEKFEEE